MHNNMKHLNGRAAPKHTTIYTKCYPVQFDHDFAVEVVTVLIRISLNNQILHRMGGIHGLLI